MKVLAVTNKPKFGVEATLRPLADCELVDKIYLVRETEVIELPKTETFLVPRVIARPREVRKNLLQRLIRELVMLLMMLHLTIIKRPDMIMNQNIAHSPLAFICGKLFRKPVVASLDNAPRAWGVMSKLVPMLKRFDVITVTGSRNREDLIEMGLSRDKVHVHLNSIDMDRFKPRPLPKIYDIISTGKLSLADKGKGKGTDTILRITAWLKEHKKDIKVGLLGRDTTGGRLQKLSEELNIVDNVEFIGWKAYSEVEYYLNSARVFVLCSQHEGLPLAVLEAMACGIPCVVSNVGDITDIAENEVNALLIDDPYDVDAFASAVLRLLEDGEFYTRLSENSQVVRGKYDFSTATRVWNNILGAVVKNASPSGGGSAD